VESAITVKGQATIPKAIREHLGLKPGDRVSFSCIPVAVWSSCRNSLDRLYGASSNPGVGGR
jgi:AbrB family looped-hinge helix DNA binding protein